jgi:hypothetical protein
MTALAVAAAEYRNHGFEVVLVGSIYRWVANHRPCKIITSEAPLARLVRFLLPCSGWCSGDGPGSQSINRRER